MRSPAVSAPHAKSFGFGERDLLKSASKAWTNSLARVVPGLFLPEIVVQAKALVCELPSKFGVLLSSWSTEDLAVQVRQSGLVANISGITLWRWLHEDAIRSWQHRCWIFPRDPNFAEEAGRILDLYEGIWEGRTTEGRPICVVCGRENQHPGTASKT